MTSILVRFNITHGLCFVMGLCTASIVLLLTTCTRSSLSSLTIFQKVRDSARKDLCLFVHADNSSGLSAFRPYSEELDAMLGTWSNEHTFIYTYGDLEVPKGHGNVIKLNRTKWEPHFAIPYMRAYSGQRKEDLWKNEKTFPMWIHVHNRMDTPLFENCAWFMRVDTDTYVNSHRLTEVLSFQDPSKDVYFGAYGGYPTQGFIFGSGGTGYIMSHALMRRINFTLCWEDIFEGVIPEPGMFEDVEVMWCIYRRFSHPAVYMDNINQFYYDNGNPSAVGYYMEKRPQCIPCYWTYHKVPPHLMYAVHRDVQSVLNIGKTKVKEGWKLDNDCARASGCVVSRVTPDVTAT